MPLIVVDACVAVKWLVREADTEKAFRLLEDPSNLFIAPDIFRCEVVNAILKQNRLGHLADDLLDRAMSELDGVMPDLVASGDVMPLAVSIARRVRHPIYDCLYLSLAEHRNATLITADEKFAISCRDRMKDDPICDRLMILRDYGRE